MVGTINQRTEEETSLGDLGAPTDHGVNYEPIGSLGFLRHMRGRRIRRWLITETCRNCPDHFRVRRSVDSKQSLLKDMMRIRCPDCLEDSLQFFTQDLGPAGNNEPCMSLNGKLWERGQFMPKDVQKKGGK
jgi:hypothetical protein